ncbi:ABC transporter substrate-binding protein [Clostridium botulinum]|uniref:ABC transporter substrate-binding protein n=1 Tax=Clostridium botulinum TaxID=1491 RepID=UPI003A7F92C7
MKFLRKKTIIANVLVSILIGSILFTGCSGSKTTSSSNNNGKNELKGEISFSTWGSLEEKKVNEDIIKLFEEKHPGTKVNLQYIPEEYTTKIDTLFLGKKAPDVIYGHPKYFTKWASQGLLMDLTEKFNEDKELMDDSKFNTKLYDAFKYEGKNIATVNGADTMVVYYNKDLFDAAGVEYPNEKWTWEQFAEAAKKLTIMGEDGKPKQFGVSIDGAYSLAETFMFSNGGKWFDDMNNPKEVKFNSKENIEALQMMQDLIFKYKVAPTSSDSKVLGGGFDAGKIAMTIDGVWSVVYRKDIKDFKWGIAEIPTVPGKEKRIPALYAGYAISNTTKNPDLAWEFSKFMQSDEAQKLLASSGLITVINKKIANSDEALNIKGAPENHKVRVTTLDKAIHNDAVMVNWDESLTKVFNPNMDLLLTNKQSAKDTANKIQSGMEEMLKQN